jgi:hypothetical protein
LLPAVTFSYPGLTIYRTLFLIYKTNFMQIDQDIKEMEGKILLLDNKKFVYCVGFIGIYYIAYLSFLTHILIHSGGFR